MPNASLRERLIRAIVSDVAESLNFTTDDDPHLWRTIENAVRRQFVRLVGRRLLVDVTEGEARMGAYAALYVIENAGYGGDNASLADGKLAALGRLRAKLGGQRLGGHDVVA